MNMIIYRRFVKYLTSLRSHWDAHRNLHHWGCSESWQKPLKSWATSGLPSAGPRWHRTEERWTELSSCSASAWNEVWRTWSLRGTTSAAGSASKTKDLSKFKLCTPLVFPYHHQTQSDQSQAEPGRSYDERTSCCSGCSRGCYCHLHSIKDRWKHTSALISLRLCVKQTDGCLVTKPAFAWWKSQHSTHYVENALMWERETCF